MTQQDKVQDQSLHNTRQDGTGSLPCGPRIAEEKESDFPALSRFKSAEAGKYTGGAVGGADAEERTVRAAAARWYRRGECGGWCAEHDTKWRKQTNGENRHAKNMIT